VRLLLDEGVPLRSAARLRELGFDASHVLEHDWQGRSDTFIVDQARKMEAVIVGYDSDFHRLLAHQNADGPSVIRVREDGLSFEQLADLIAATVTSQGEHLHAGALVSVTRYQVRLRLLPLRG